MWTNAAPALDESSFDDLFDLCRPRSAEERWTRIPWTGQLWAGRQRAGLELKPLFVWAMNGHPLGCV